MRKHQKNMIQQVFATIIVLLSICVTGALGAVEYETETVSALDASAIAEIVVQDDGRLKPLDTVARKVLLGFHGRQTFDKTTARAWFFQLLTNPKQAHKRRVFTIRTPAVVAALGMKPLKENRYSFNDVIQPLIEHEPLLQALMEREEKSLDETERQLTRLYRNMSFYRSCIQALACFIPEIPIDDADIAAAFGGTVGSSYSYYFFISQRSSPRVRDFIDGVTQAEKADPEFRNMGLEKIGSHLSRIKRHNSSDILTLIPAISDAEGAAWRSAWAVLDEPQLRPQDAKIMKALDDLVGAAYRGEQEACDRAAEQYKQAVGEYAHIGMEVTYNTADLFYRSLYFYIAAFLVLLVFWMHAHRGWYRVSLGLVASGALLHAGGVVMRCIIMERPPVSTLYESIIVASLVSVLFGLIIELWMRNSFALLSAIMMGVVLQFIGFSYAADGDTMGMLQAVLNNTFWLATHVVTIIIGYGISLVAGFFGHILLIRYIFYSEETEYNKQLLKIARYVALVALFFTTLGTILGGIWADQSWGRFWGWDPKENGALLIVLWLLIAIHGIISGELKKIGFAAILALTNICVAVAWFGVNLLNVGLHSYGFSDSTAFVLGAFCGGEMIVVVIAAIWAQQVSRSQKESRLG